MIGIVALIIEYVRTMVIYIIFYSFVEILLPKSNFKKYVSLVMGLIMIILILKPISNIVSQHSEPLQKQLAAIDTELGKKVTAAEKEQYEEIQNKMIIDNYKSQLTSQMNTLLTRQLNVTILSVDIDVESDIDDPFFGQIKGIQIKVKDASIITEPITVQLESNTEEDKPQDEESEISKNIKKIISDFYNMSADNIHVIEV